MIFVVPVDSPDDTAGISKHFARSTHFAIIDNETGNREMIENPFAGVSKGAGIKLIDFLVKEYRMNKIIAFELGLKVQQMATEKEIQLIIITGKIRQLKQLLKLIFPAKNHIKE
jgi:predicted Fe-Mo cluster-binding NifX family protein